MLNIIRITRLGHVVHFTAAVDLASPVRLEDLQGPNGHPMGWRVWGGGGQENSQERMKWMRWGRVMFRAVSFIPLTLSSGDESRLASVSGSRKGNRGSALFPRQDGADEEGWRYKSSQ